MEVTTYFALHSQGAWLKQTKITSNVIDARGCHPLWQGIQTFYISNIAFLSVQMHNFENEFTFCTDPFSFATNQGILVSFFSSA